MMLRPEPLPKDDTVKAMLAVLLTIVLDCKPQVLGGYIDSKCLGQVQCSFGVNYCFQLYNAEFMDMIM